VPSRAGYEKFPNPASRYAMAGVFVAVTKGGEVRVAVTGAGSKGVFRLAAMEKALAGNFSPAAIQNVAVDAAGLLADLHASAAYRANLVKVMAERATAGA
jgi:carbon-monoxide dehydrogenase medium subunit